MSQQFIYVVLKQVPWTLQTVCVYDEPEKAETFIAEQQDPELYSIKRHAVRT